MSDCYEGFMARNDLFLSYEEKEKLMNRIRIIDENVECVHKKEEPLEFIEYMLVHMPEGKIVEAGCYKGGGTAKISIISKMLGREMFVFDSFEGLPNHHENHTYNIFGNAVTFEKGEYSSSYENTVNNVKKYGEVGCCTFIKGWFRDTFPGFCDEIAGAYIDVDLVESVRECITKFYPLLSKGGVIFCHDGHLPLVVELLESDEFWTDIVKCEKPFIKGLGTKKLIQIIKEK